MFRAEHFNNQPLFITTVLTPAMQTAFVHPFRVFHLKMCENTMTSCLESGVLESLREARNVAPKLTVSPPLPGSLRNYHYGCG